MGGSCSICCQSVVTPIDVSFNQLPITTTTTTSIICKSTRFIENCIVIWLFDDPSNKYKNEKEQIRRFVYQLKIFTNPNQCIDYIRTIEDEKIFLITSAKYQSLEYLTQIEKIYIFDCYSSQQIYSNINNLCQQLQQDIDLCEFDLIYFSVISNNSSSISLTKEEISFIFTQLSNKILNRFKFENNSKHAWIDYCRLHYVGHIEQLRIIDEFANYYRPNTALDWLRRTCFMSKILNRMKRTREIDILYKLGFFIKHINMQLLHLYEENRLLIKNISFVYRGKTMIKDEFDIRLKNQSNGLISFSNFLLTTINKQDSIEFLRHRLAIHPDRVAIIFEIHIDHMIFNEEYPFANIKTDEICFSAGSIFRIESIEQRIENSLTIWFIKLKTIQNDDYRIINLLKPFQTNEIHENPLSCLGKLLIDMGEYRRAEQFFLEFINDKAVQSQPHRLVRVQNGLAAIHIYKGEYMMALEYYKKAFQISLTYLPANHSDFILMYKNIGDCYLYQNNYNHALQNYEQAIDIIENHTQIHKCQINNELQNLVCKTKQFIENKN